MPPASVTSLTREVAETTDDDQSVPTTDATDGTMTVATTTTEPTTEATEGTMPVTTAALETTGETTIETTETTGVFDISKIISIKIKELRTNSDSIPNNISCNELPNCSTPKSNRFAVESNSLNCNFKNSTSLFQRVRIQKLLFQKFMMFLNMMY